MAKPPIIGGTLSRVTGRAALGVAGGVKRGLSLAAAPILLPLGQTVGALSASVPGRLALGVLGIGTGLFKGVRSGFKVIQDEMEKSKQKLEQITNVVSDISEAVEKEAETTKKSKSKQAKLQFKSTTKKLEDDQEDEEEDISTGKGKITSRLGSIMRKMAKNAKKSAGGFLSKIPGVGKLGGLLGAAGGLIGSIKAAAAPIMAWVVSIAAIALVIKFILDNIKDWLDALWDNIRITVGSWIESLLGSWAETFGLDLEKKFLKSEFSERLQKEEAKLTKAGFTIDEASKIAFKNISDDFRQEMIDRGYSEQKINEILGASDPATGSDEEAARRAQRTTEQAETDIKNIETAITQAEEQAKIVTPGKAASGTVLLGRQTDPALKGKHILDIAKLKELLVQRKKELIPLQKRTTELNRRKELENIANTEDFGTGKTMAFSRSNFKTGQTNKSVGDVTYKKPTAGGMPPTGSGVNTRHDVVQKKEPNIVIAESNHGNNSNSKDRENMWFQSKALQYGV